MLYFSLICTFKKEARMKSNREGAIALMIAGFIVVVLGGMLLSSVPVSSDLRAGVAMVAPAGGIIVIVGLAFWLDATVRSCKRGKRG